MTTRTYSKTIARNSEGQVDSVVVSWAGLLNGDDGNAFENAAYTDRSAQVTGTFGAGGNCRILGSNDGTNFATLTDPQGNALDFTSAKIEQVTECTRYIKPEITAGDGTTDIAVSLNLVRRVK